jgi:hypothetical protein
MFTSENPVLALGFGSMYITLTITVPWFVGIGPVSGR